MDTLEIGKILKSQLKGVFTGVYAEDELPQVLRRPFGLVINTDPSYLPGKHWTSVWINRYGYGEFFDTRGVGPEPPVRRYLERMAPKGFVYNKRRIQSDISTICGMYVIEFLISRRRNPRMEFELLLRRLYPYEDTFQNDVETYRRFQERYGDKARPLFDIRYVQ